MAERNIRETKQWIRTGRILTEALPYLQHYRGTCFVVKYGGHAMGDERLARDFANDMVLLTIGGIQPIVVHGGGPQIGEMLSRLKIKSEFVDGLRVTDKATVEIVEMVLSGSINKQVVHALTRSGGRAVGLSGKDGGLIRARKLRRTQRDPDSNIEKLLDLGFVGEPDRVDPDIIHALVEAGITPVIAPIGAGDQGETYNINADTAAGAIAGAIGAERLFLLTDVAGVLDKEGGLIAEMTVSEAQARMADGTITGGMIPKVQTCVDAIRANTEAAVILDGRVPHSILLEIFTNRGVGTLIRPD